MISDYLKIFDEAIFNLPSCVCFDQSSYGILPNAIPETTKQQINYFPFLMHKVGTINQDNYYTILPLISMIFCHQILYFQSKPVHASGRVLQELDLQEFAQFFACFHPSPYSPFPPSENRQALGQMRTTETSFLLDFCHGLSILDGIIIPFSSVHWSVILASNRFYLCQ